MGENSMKMFKLILISVFVGLSLGSSLFAGKISQKQALERAEEAIQAQLGSENRELFEDVRNQISVINGTVEETEVTQIIENAVTLHVLTLSAQQNDSNETKYETDEESTGSDEELAHAIALSQITGSKEEANEAASYELIQKLQQKEQEEADCAFAYSLEQEGQEAHPASAQHQAPQLDIRNVVLQANKQTGATCGPHAAINAQAINYLWKADKPITAHNIQNQAKIYHNYITKETNNLWDNELINFAGNINLLHIEDFYILHINKHAHIQIPYNNPEAVYAALQKIKTVHKALKHCICHIGPPKGGHWVLISVIKEPGNAPRLVYLDSANAEVKPGSAQHKLIEYVYNAVTA